MNVISSLRGYLAFRTRETREDMETYLQGSMETVARMDKWRDGLPLDQADSLSQLQQAAVEFNRLKEIMGKSEVSYGVRGSLYTQGTFGTEKLKVDKMGTIDLSELKPVE